MYNLDTDLEIEQQEVWERWRCEVDKGQTPQRIDKYLAEHMTGTSRNRIQNAADAGNVWVNGKPVSGNTVPWSIINGETLEIELK